MPVEEVKSEPPAAGPKDLRVYSNNICPFAERAHLALAAKNVAADVIYVSLDRKPEWYLKLYPVGKVPLLELNGKTLPESLIIFEYLDEKFPGKKLFTNDPWTKAQIKAFVEQFSNLFFSNYYKFYRGNEDETTASSVQKAIQLLEDHLKQNDHLFLFGADWTAADLLVWPWFERLEAARSAFPKLKEAVTAELFPNVFKWIERMWGIAPVKAAGVSTEGHLKFLKSVTEAKQHNYDISDKNFKVYVKSN